MRKVQIVVTLTTDRDADELADMILDGRIDQAGALDIKVSDPSGSVTCNVEQSWPS